MCGGSCYSGMFRASPQVRPVVALPVLTVCLGCATCFCRERGQPYFLYIALAHMHVPLAPPPGASATNDNQVYTASLQEMDGLVGAIKSISDETDRDNTLIWFTGWSARIVVVFIPA